MKVDGHLSLPTVRTRLGTVQACATEANRGPKTRLSAKLEISGLLGYSDPTGGERVARKLGSNPSRPNVKLILLRAILSHSDFRIHA